MPGRPTCTTPGCNVVPAVAGGFAGAWANTSIDLWGILARGLANYNYTRTGSLLPQGAPVNRDFASDQYEWYIQDQWRGPAKPHPNFWASSHPEFTTLGGEW